MRSLDRFSADPGAATTLGCDYALFSPQTGLLVADFSLAGLSAIPLARLSSVIQQLQDMTAPSPGPKSWRSSKEPDRKPPP